MSLNNSLSCRSKSFAGMALTALVCLMAGTSLADNSESISLLAPSGRLMRCYSLGAETFVPVAITLHVALDVKSKKHTDKEIVKEISDARKTDQTECDIVQKILHEMGAPDSVSHAYEDSQKIFANPLAISPVAKQDYPSNSDDQTIESFFDEADSAVPDDNGLLTAWLKLSQGKYGLWAYHLGQFSTSISRIQLSSGKPPLLDEAGPIAYSAPPGTSKALIIVLESVADEYKTGKLKQQTLDDADKAIGETFGF